MSEAEIRALQYVEYGCSGEGKRLISEIEAENTRLKELLYKFSDALEVAVTIEPNLMHDVDINECINKIREG